MIHIFSTHHPRSCGDVLIIQMTVLITTNENKEGLLMKLTTVEAVSDLIILKLAKIGYICTGGISYFVFYTRISIMQTLFHKDRKKIISSVIVLEYFLLY